jgi:hypothetical protein
MFTFCYTLSLQAQRAMLFKGAGIQFYKGLHGNHPDFSKEWFKIKSE